VLNIHHVKGGIEKAGGTINQGSAGRAERRRRFRMSSDGRDRVSVREKSSVGKWNNIFDGSLCEQSDLPPQSKMLVREPHRLGG
jgi:hypothetical protein